MNQVKGNKLTIGQTLLGGNTIIGLGRNGKRHLIATVVNEDGVKFTMRIDPRETYYLA